MKLLINTKLLGLGATIALVMNSSAASVAFRASVASSTDVDWASSSNSSQVSEKYFTGDDGESLSLKLTVTATGASSNIRGDGTYGAHGWQPDGGSNANSYRWATGEVASWSISILDRSNGNADVSPLYNIELTAIQTTNEAAVTDGAKIILNNGANTVDLVALNGTGDQDHTIAPGFNASAMILTTDSNGSQYFRIDDLTFSVTAVPEPSSTMLFGLGGLALIMRRRK